MIVAADVSQFDAAWNIIDRCRTALLEQGILQWDKLYPTAEIVRADIADRRLYLLTLSGICRAVVTIDVKKEAQYSTVLWTTAEPALIVHRLCVEPGFQGHGYGRQLMDYVETYARHHRYTSLRLDAYSGNPRAVALYQRLGYHEAGRVFFPRRVLPFKCFELSLDR